MLNGNNYASLQIRCCIWNNGLYCSIYFVSGIHAIKNECLHSKYDNLIIHYRIVDIIIYSCENILYIESE